MKSTDALNTNRRSHGDISTYSLSDSKSDLLDELIASLEPIPKRHKKITMEKLTKGAEDILSSLQYQVFLQKHLFGMSAAAIARINKISEPRVHKILKQISKNLLKDFPQLSNKPSDKAV